MSMLDSRGESGDLQNEDMSKPRGSGADGVAILSDIADKQVAAEDGSVEAGVDGEVSSGGFSVPERHRVVPPPDSGNSPDRGAEVSPGSGADGVAILSDIADRQVAAGEQPVESGPNGKFAGVEPAPDGVTEVRPLEPPAGPVTELPESTDVPRFPSELAERRAERFSSQGFNDLGYEGTCGLASSAEMLSDLTGENFSENDVVRHAAENGLCRTNSSDPADLGGTTVEALRVLQQDAGVHPVSLRDCDLDDLARCVDSGDGVLAAVKAAEYWPSVGIYESESARSAALAQRGTDHVVWVTGVSRNPGTSAVTGFFVNDTGRADGAGVLVSNAEMRRAWEQRGGQVLVARRGAA